MRRVAYITPLHFGADGYLGGGERFPLNVAKAVAGTGRYTVELISYADAVETEVVHPLADGVDLRLLPVAARRDGAERLSWKIIEVVQRSDLVHVHQIFSRSGEVAVMAAKLIGRPVCATDHGGASSWLGRSLGMLSLVDRVVPNSNFAASLVDTPANVEVVPGGVDDRFFSPPDPGSVQRDRVVFVGRWLPHKGIDRLLSALPDGVPLTICGTPHRDDYTKLLTALARGRQVEFVTGADDAQIRELYRRALCVVLPSVYVDYYGDVSAWPELMGIALLEGMACGAPAICSRVGGMPEFVKHGETGFVFDELAELTEAIRRLATEPELVDRLGRAAHRRVADRYGLAAVGAATAGIYDQLLQRVPA